MFSSEHWTRGAEFCAFGNNSTSWAVATTTIRQQFDPLRPLDNLRHDRAAALQPKYIAQRDCG